jgi:hypothetical protein
MIATLGLALLALMAGLGAEGGDAMVAWGQVTDVTMGYRWVGWHEGSVYAGLQPQLEVTLHDGTTWRSCWNAPVEPTRKACAGNEDVTGRKPSVNYVGCQLFEYTGIPDGSNIQNTLGPSTYGLPNSQHLHTTRRLAPLLAMISMAAMKGLPIQLQAWGEHPGFLQPDCFDAVKVCFTGTCL